MITIETLGYVAGLVGSLITVPQTYKMIRTGCARDISMTSYIMLVISLVLWLIYGVFKGAPPIVFWNTIAIINALVVVVLKAKPNLLLKLSQIKKG